MISSQLCLRVLAKFTFPIIIVPYSTLRKKVIAQFQKREKNDRSPYSFENEDENDDLPLWRAPAIKKKPPFLMCAR